MCPILQEERQEEHRRPWKEEEARPLRSRTRNAGHAKGSVGESGASGGASVYLTQFGDGTGAVDERATAAFSTA